MPFDSPFVEFCNSYTLFFFQDWEGYTALTAEVYSFSFVFFSSRFPFSFLTFSSFPLSQVGQNIQIVGDDLLVTNPKRIATGIEKKACNALLLKVLLLERRSD
jgi:hypothetical protein